MITNSVSVFRLVFYSCLFLSQIAVSQGEIGTVEDSLWRAEQEYLNGYYIPANEEEAFVEIKALSPKGVLEEFAKVPEDTVVIKLRYKLGMWLMQNWQLDAGSRLAYYLGEKGLVYPEDRVDYLIISLHRHINNKKQNYQELIQSFQEKRKKEAEEREARKKATRKVIYIGEDTTTQD